MDSKVCVCVCRRRRWCDKACRSSRHSNNTFAFLYLLEQFLASASIVPCVQLTSNVARVISARPKRNVAWLTQTNVVRMADCVPPHGSFTVNSVQNVQLSFGTNWRRATRCFFFVSPIQSHRSVHRWNLIKMSIDLFHSNEHPCDFCAHIIAHVLFGQSNKFTQHTYIFIFVRTI